MQPYGPPRGQWQQGPQGHPQPPQGYGYGPPVQPPLPQPVARPMSAPKPLARLPLQIGTTATWGAARAAVALFPGLAIVAGGIATLVGGEVEAGAAILVFGGMLVVYAVWH